MQASVCVYVNESESIKSERLCVKCFCYCRKREFSHQMNAHYSDPLSQRARCRRQNNYTREDCLHLMHQRQRQSRTMWKALSCYFLMKMQPFCHFFTPFSFQAINMHQIIPTMLLTLLAHNELRSVDCNFDALQLSSYFPLVYSFDSATLLMEIKKVCLLAFEHLASWRIINCCLFKKVIKGDLRALWERFGVNFNIKLSLY